MDLENAVLLQELMAMREDKTEWRNRVFLLAKEKSALDLKLNSKEAQERAFLAHVDHLKAEVRDLKEQIARLTTTAMSATEGTTTMTPTTATTTTMNTGSSDTTRGTSGSGDACGDGGDISGDGGGRRVDSDSRTSSNEDNDGGGGTFADARYHQQQQQPPLRPHHQQQRQIPARSQANGVDDKGANNNPMTAELVAALRRETNLKARVNELVAALEKLTRNSEARHQQSADFVDDLKRANAALVTAFEKTKKKHIGKVKKMEAQIHAMAERHESTVDALKQRIALLEDCDEEEEGEGFEHDLS